MYAENKSVSEPYYILFATLYVVISISAFLHNSLLLISLHLYQKKKRSRLIRRPGSRFKYQRRCSRRRILSEKTRDHLIGYLAVFDLLLSFTMPFTAIDVLTSYWPLGPDTEVLAKAMRAVPTAVVYGSSGIIVLIAINCYRQILRSSEKQLGPKEIRYMVIVLVGLSIVISSPVPYYTKLDPLVDNKLKMLLDRLPSTNNTASSVQSALSENLSVRPIDNVGVNNKTEKYPMCRKHGDVRLSHIAFVNDDWPKTDDGNGNMRLYYSIMSLIAQSILPFCVISYCYYSVYKRLKRQAAIQNRVLLTEAAVRRRNEREKKRNKLLMTISLVYLITWLPLGIFGTLSDGKLNMFGTDPETPTILFMLCNLVGMSSACANPIIYGYRNKHLRKGKEKIDIKVSQRAKEILLNGALITNNELNSTLHFSFRSNRSGQKPVRQFAKYMETNAGRFLGA